jgi:hypothetical protein
MPTPAYSVPDEEGGWTIQRLQVLHDALGIWRPLRHGRR